jgi:hypothetical protein
MRPCFALLLVALWLPATAHCVLDAATGWGHDACTSACGSDATAEHADGCDLIESGAYAPSAGTLAAPVPQLTASVCLNHLHRWLEAQAVAETPPPRPSDDASRRLASLVFTTRAAPPSRAPSRA